MEESAARKLRFLALQVVGAVAAIHFVVGAAELLRFAAGGLLGEYLTGGQALSQPEPLLFTLSALALLGGVVAVGIGRLDHRRAYLLGAGLMGTYIVGWLAWHSVLSHGLGEAAAGGTSHLGLVDVVASHYADPLVGLLTGTDQPGRETLAAISKTLEAVALALFGTLLFVDPRAARAEPDNPVASMGGEAADE